MNKPRLIDANRLLRHLSDWWLSETPSGEVTVINDKLQKTSTNKIIEECIKAVEEQPTAYNVEGVIERLESLKQHEQEQHAYATVWGIQQSIEIVKGGA